jgi:hypothetical protein
MTAVIVIVIILIVVGILVAGIAMGIKDSTPDSRTGISPAQARAHQQALIICPYCQNRGGVTWHQVKRKQGISGAKATGAVLTGGLSVVATGLSKKGFVRACSCAICGMKWDVA